METVRQVFSTRGFMPHGFCYLWDPELVSLHVVSDSLISIAYFVIPLMLLRLARKRRDIPFNGMFLCFGVFIVACGATHAVEVWTLWVPVYWLSGAIKAITAVASLLTAVFMAQLMPQALSLPHPAELRKTNAALEERALMLQEQATLLRQSEENYRSLFEGAPYGILRISLDGIVLMANPTLVSMLGLELKEDIVGHALPSAFRSAMNPDKWTNDIRAETCEEAEIVWTRKDGKKILLRAKARILPQCAHFPACCEMIVDNVSERQLLEEELRQAQKMECVGRLAGGIAHDFNNILVGILGYGGLLVKKLSPGTTVHEYSSQILKSAVRARNLTMQLLAFGRKQSLQPRVIDLNREIADMTEMLVRTLSEDIRLTQELAPNLKASNVDPVQFQQVILNLAVNARDAMPNGGTLQVKTANEYETNKASSMPKHKTYAVVSVVDSGSGIDPEVLPHIFEPFFTTKKSGRGTGLGLAMVYSIVKQSGGFIKVMTDPGHGTSFHIYLPCVEEQCEGPQPENSLPAFYHGCEAILLVEDDEIVRTLASEVLQSEGYRVLSAGSGSEAIDLFRKSPLPIELLVTDVVMPDMNGVSLAKLLKQDAPKLKVLYMSGYVDRNISAQLESNKQTFFLAKPFLPQEFVARIREILDFSQGRFRMPAS